MIDERYFDYDSECRWTVSFGPEKGVAGMCQSFGRPYSSPVYVLHGTDITLADSEADAKEVV